MKKYMALALMTLLAAPAYAASQQSQTSDEYQAEVQAARDQEYQDMSDGLLYDNLTEARMTVDPDLAVVTPDTIDPDSFRGPGGGGGGGRGGGGHGGGMPGHGGGIGRGPGHGGGIGRGPGRGPGHGGGIGRGPGRGPGHGGGIGRGPGRGPGHGPGHGPGRGPGHGPGRGPGHGGGWHGGHGGFPSRGHWGRGNHWWRGRWGIGWYVHYRWWPGFDYYPGACFAEDDDGYLFAGRGSVDAVENCDVNSPVKGCAFVGCD